MPFTPQVVHTEKSLSSVALLAVSQLCTTRSKSLRPFVLAIALEPFRLDQAATQGRRGLLIQLNLWRRPKLDPRRVAPNRGRVRRCRQG